MIKNVCVVGAGTMGSGIALAAALNKFPVEIKIKAPVKTKNRGFFLAILSVRKF